MKLITYLIAWFLTLSSTYGFCGELRFFIDDDNENYKIIATRYALDEPLFGINYMVINDNSLDEVVSDNIVNLSDASLPYNFYIGFDYMSDQSNSCWPFIGEGKYEFKIYRDNILLISFRVDLRHCAETSPDIIFYYNSTENTLFSDNDTRIYNGNEYYSWQLLSEELNLDCYENSILITNSISSTNINSILESADYGFPYNSYDIGTVFNNGENINMWRGSKYGLRASPELISEQTGNKKFRQWLDYNIYSASAILTVKDKTNQFQSVYEEVYPLTVTNYLEGGSGGSYSVTWQAANKTDTLNSGEVYFAFDNIKTEDQYNINVGQTIQSQYGTDWQFLNWDDGTTSTTITDVAVTAPTTRTAYYKGNMRSDEANAFANNNQRKVVRTADGVLHLVYESMGKIWYTKSSERKKRRIKNLTPNIDLFA